VLAVQLAPVSDPLTGPPQQRQQRPIPLRTPPPRSTSQRSPAQLVGATGAGQAPGTRSAVRDGSDRVPASRVSHPSPIGRPARGTAARPPARALLTIALRHELEERRQHAQPMVDRPRLAPQHQPILNADSERDDVLADHTLIDVREIEFCSMDPAEEVRQPERIRPLRVRPAAVVGQPDQGRHRLGRCDARTDDHEPRQCATRRRWTGTTVNAPTTPTTSSLVAGAHAMSPVGRITR
jgi:hypothetical protein